MATALKEEAASLLSLRESSAASSRFRLLPSWAARRGFLGLSLGAWAGAGALGLVAVVAAASAVASVRARASAQPPAPVADSCSWPEYRLPTGAAPEAYSVRWDIGAAFAAPYPFSGAVEVVVARAADAAACTACVLLHARGLTISGAAAAVEGGEGGAAAWLPTAVAADPLPLSERVVVRLPAALVAQPRLRLAFNFSGQLSDTGIAFY